MRSFVDRWSFYTGEVFTKTDLTVVLTMGNMLGVEICHVRDTIRAWAYKVDCKKM